MNKNNVNINTEEVRIAGWKIFFGKYPQTVVVDNYLINALNKIDKVNEFGYIELDGNEYLKKSNVTTMNNFSYGVGYLVEQGQQDYYFRVEPIEWICLSDISYKDLEKIDTSKIPTTLIAAGALNNLIFDEKSNSYKDSFIRKWLNKDFFESAFSKKQQKDMLVNELSDGVNDFVYLLSKDEVDLHFSEADTGTKATDFSISNFGANSSSNRTNWFLRSMGKNNKVHLVHHRGGVMDTYIDHNAGVVPVITLKPGVLDIKRFF